MTFLITLKRFQTASASQPDYLPRFRLRNYDQLWCTSSLRALVVGDLTVQLLRKACTRGCSGVVASSFRS